MSPPTFELMPILISVLTLSTHTSIVFPSMSTDCFRDSLYVDFSKEHYYIIPKKLEKISHLTLQTSSISIVVLQYYYSVSQQRFSAWSSASLKNS